MLSLFKKKKKSRMTEIKDKLLEKVMGVTDNYNNKYDRLPSVIYSSCQFKIFCTK